MDKIDVCPISQTMINRVAKGDVVLKANEPYPIIPQGMSVEFLQPERNVQVDIVTIDEAEVPEYAHDGDAGFDLRNNSVEFTLFSGKAVMVPTGIKVAVPRGYEIQVRPRSGLARKEGITVLNSPGTIDSNYRGEIGVILFNATQGDYRVMANERIAQGVLAPVYRAIFTPVSSLPETERGSGGFGSSGKG